MNLLARNFGTHPRRRVLFSPFRGFDDIFDGDYPPDNGEPAAIAIDVEETEDSYIVEADLPGVEKENLDVTLDNGTLTIAVQHQERKEDSGRNFIHMERRSRGVSRSIYLPNSSLERDVDAQLNDGVLTLEIAKAEDKNRRRVNIR